MNPVKIMKLNKKNNIPNSAGWGCTMYYECHHCCQSLTRREIIFIIKNLYMKFFFLFFFQIVAISGFSQSKESEVVSLESEMINFFQKTLEDNYGRKNALDLLVKGMERYHFNYLLEVDKERLKEINKKLYTAGWLYSYFLDGADLNDSCRLYVPQGVSLSLYRKSAEFRKASKRLKSDDPSSIGLIIDSAKYVYSKAQVENIVLPFKKNEDGFTYRQRELEHALHPALKHILEMEKVTGDTPSSAIWGLIAANTNSICSDFKTDRDIQMYLTLYFWKYLCHFANIDFYTGMDRTSEILKEAMVTPLLNN